jgi:hypothetical protein
VWRLDRWGSSVTDLLATLQELEHLGFVSLTEALASSRELSRTIHQTGEAPLCVNAVPLRRPAEPRARPTGDPRRRFGRSDAAHHSAKTIHSGNDEKQASK